jgi:hypothetical protein
MARIATRPSVRAAVDAQLVQEALEVKARAA